MKTKKGLTILKRVLALGLGLALLAGSALAEAVTELCRGVEESAHYACTMPDGRMLFYGKREEGNGKKYTPYMKCLNADRTVSWDYLEEDETVGYVHTVAVSRDGTIKAAFLKEYGDEDDHDTSWYNVMTLRTFTSDGKPTGEPVVLHGSFCGLYECEPSFLQWEYRTEDGERKAAMLDWNGNVLSGSGTDSDGHYDMIEEEDGVLFFGEAEIQGGRAKMMKKTGVTGEILWETMIDFQSPDADEAYLAMTQRTGDGGYAAFLWEREVRGFGKHMWRASLVKLDAQGQVQWIVKDVFGREEEFDNMNKDLAVYNGKIVAYSAVYEGYDFDKMDNPQEFRWYDESGKELGVTRLDLEAGDFPALREYLEKKGKGKKTEAQLEQLEMIPMADGLWALANGIVADAKNEEWLDESVALIRIPEPEKE